MNRPKLVALFAASALLSACSSSLLQRAAQEGRIQDVQGLLARGHDPNKGGADPLKDKCGRPLSCAVMNGHLDAVIALLEAGADPNQTGGKFPPLRYALQQRDPAFTELLLDFGADPKQRGHILWDTQLTNARLFRHDLLPMLEEAAAGKRKPRYFRGTGITLGRTDGQTMVKDVLRGTPAHAAGIRPGDRILSIDGRPTEGMEPDAIVRFIHERPARAGITYTISAGGGSPRDVRLKRVIITPAMRRSHLALEAQFNRVHDAERDGDAEAAAGRHGAALERYSAALREANWNELDWPIREKALRSARSMSPPPEVPESARERAAKAMAYIKMSQSPEDFTKALNELAAVLQDAPWWADVYMNYALLQEKLRNYDAAVWALRWYLAAAPDAPDTPAVKSKIMELGVTKEQGR